MLAKSIHLLKRLVNRLRQRYYRAIVIRQCGAWQAPLYVNFRSSVTRKTTLGKNVNFNGLKVKGRGQVIIGDNFHSGENCLLMTENHKYDGGNAIPYDSEVGITADIVIEANVWLGDRVIILPGVRIGEGAIIQAGSVVVRDVEPFGIAGGHPAKVFKCRDREAYQALKEKNRFH